MIHYPPPLHAGSTIGLTAPSSGVQERCHRRLDLAIGHLKAQGFQVLEGNCLRSDYKHVSAAKDLRAQELMRLWNNPQIGMIFPPWGGELLHEILPLLDFNQMKQNPTWIQGYSDISTLLLPITLLTGIATSHGINLMDFIPNQLDPLSRVSLEVLRKRPGESFRQYSSEKWQKNWADIAVTPEAPYSLSEKTEWKVLGGSQVAVQFHGRLLGGCLDTIAFLAGTKFGDVPAFAHNSKSEGMILYLENCEQNPCSVHRHLSNLKLAGWFKHASGILLGRSAGPDADSPEKLFYAEAITDVLGDLSIPVIYDVDAGHRVPQMTLINGALAEVYVSEGKGWVEQKFV